MKRVWTPAIRQLQSRLKLVGMLDAFGRVVLVAAPVALALVVASRYVAWIRFFLPYAAGLLALVVLGAFVFGWLRARRSEIYCAKAIDLTSELHDRLACSVEWCDLPKPDPFQTGCIELFALELRAKRWQLKLPRTRPRLIVPTIGCTILLASAIAFHVRRPAPRVEVDARVAARLDGKQAEAARRVVEGLETDVNRLDDPQLMQVAHDLNVAVHELEQGSRDRQSALAQIDQLRQQALASERRLDKLGDSAAQATGRTAELARELSRGDAGRAGAALERLIEPIRSGQLSEEEMGQLIPMVQALSEMARGVSEPDATHLAEAAKMFRAGEFAKGAEALSDAKAVLPLLQKSLSQAAASRKLEQTAQKLLRVLDGSNPAAQSAVAQTATSGIGQKDDGAGQNTPPPESFTDPGAADSISAGGESGEHGATALHGSDKPEKNPELQLQGVWNGKVMRQFFEDGDSAKSGEEASQLLVEHEKVIEERFRHDEIPFEYRDAVKAYFAVLHQRGSQWTQGKK